MLYFWLAVILFLTVLEAATVNLVSIWFIASAVVSLILSIFIDDLFIQFAVFVLLGTILLLLTRKQLMKLLHIKDEKTNADRVVGMEAVVTEDISKNSPGEVSVLGKRWTAISNHKITKGSTVKVISIEGVKLSVEKIKEDEK